MSLIRSHILVCTGTGCTSSESPKIIAEFEKQLAAHGMDKEAQVVRTGCFGLCALGPIVTIYPEGACYTHVTVDDVEEIVAGVEWTTILFFTGLFIEPVHHRLLRFSRKKLLYCLRSQVPYRYLQKCIRPDNGPALLIARYQSLYFFHR